MNTILEIAEKIMMSEAGMSVVVSIIGIITGLVLKAKWVKKYELERCMIALKTGVQEVYETYVKGLKIASLDGKLTDVEKSEAREKAYQCAKDILKEEGIDLAKHYGPRISKAIIEELVKRSKTMGAMAKGIVGPGEVK